MGAVARVVGATGTVVRTMELVRSGRKGKRGALMAPTEVSGAMGIMVMLVVVTVARA